MDFAAADQGDIYDVSHLSEGMVQPDLSYNSRNDPAWSARSSIYGDVFGIQPRGEKHCDVSWSHGLRIHSDAVHSL